MASSQDTSAVNSIDKKLKECLDSGNNYTTTGMIECEVRAKNAWDVELNKYYKLLTQTLSAGEKEKLKTAQKNWLVFRDAEEAFSSAMYGNMQGTMWSVTKISVDENLVKQRALELKAYYDDKTLK